MSAPAAALNAYETATLNSPSSVRTFLLGVPVDPGSPFATARVYLSTVLQPPLTDIQTQDDSADWLNCRFGMTVWIGTTAGTNDKGVFYIRKTPAAGLLYIGEIQSADTGLRTVINRDTGPIVPGDYITIFETYNLHAGRSKIAFNYGSSDANFYKFYGLAYTNQNTAPAPYFQGDTHKAIRLPDGDSTVPVSASVTAKPFLDSQTVVSYAWTTPAAMTSVTGDTTDTVSGDLPQGFHTLYCLATLSDGATETAIRCIWVYADTGSVVPTPVSAASYSDVRTRQSRKMTLHLEDNLLMALDPESMVMVIEEPLWLGDNAEGYSYAYSTTTTASDPGAGAIHFDNATLASATKLYISETTATGNSVAAAIALWDDAATGLEQIKVYKASDPTKYAIYNVTGSNTDNGTWDTVNLTYVAGAGTIANGNAVKVEFLTTGDVNVAGRSVPSTTRQFVGWLNTSPGTAQYGKKGSDLEVIGSGAVLESLGSDSQRLEQFASPAGWQQAPVDLMTITYFIWYLLKWGVVNWTSLFCYYPLDAATPQSANPLDATEKTYLAQIMALAARASDANCGTDSDGDLHVHLHPSLIDPTLRSGLVQRDALTPDLISNVDVQVNNRNTTRRVIAGAFSYDGVNMMATRSWAPGQASGQMSGEEELPGIITDGEVLVDPVTGQVHTKLDLYAGQQYQRRNQRYTGFTFTLPGNRDVYEPAHMLPLAYTIDAANSPTGSIITGQAIPDSITKQRDENGGAKIELTVEPLTSGVYGEAYPYPPVEPDTFGDSGTIPFITTIPDFGLTSPTSQNDFSPATAPASQVKIPFLAKDASGSGFRVVLRKGPAAYKDISPSSADRTALGVPIKLIEGVKSTKKLYLLCEDGIAWTTNYLATTVAWSTKLNSNVVDAHIFDFKHDDGGWVPENDFLGNPFGLWIAGIGWTAVNGQDSLYNTTGISITFSFASAVVTRLSMIYNLINGPHKVGSSGLVNTEVNTDAGHRTIVIYPDGAGINQASYVDGPTSTAITSVNLQINADYGGWGGSSVITHAELDLQFDGINISDITESVGGNVYWLTKKAVSGIDYVFCAYTRDGFKTVHDTKVAKYDADLTYNVQVSRTNPAYVWVSAGAAGDDAAIYFSSNGAVSFVIGAALNTRGGAFALPVSLPGGGPNKLHKNIVYVKGVSTNLQAQRDGFSAVTLATGSSDYPQASHSLFSFRLDGRYAAVILKSRDVYIANDGGQVTWTFVGNAPGTGAGYCLTGWSTNRKLFLASGDQAFAYSIDRGINWVDLWSEYETYRAATFGGSIAQIILSAFFSAASVFSKAIS